MNELTLPKAQRAPIKLPRQSNRAENVTNTKTYLSVAHTGGQGKTTLAQMLYSMLRREGHKYKLVSADFLDESSQSKLGKLFPEKVEELGIGANLVSTKLENNANAPLRYWDRFGEILLAGGSVVDVGANVVSQLLQWGRHRRISQVLRHRNAPEIDIFLTTKAERHSIENAAHLVHEMVEQDAFPIGNVIVVCNEVGGPFEPNQVASAISRVAPTRNIHYMALPRCTSELWESMEKTCTSVDDVLTLSEDEICEKFGVDVWTASAGLGDLHEWTKTVYANLREAGI